MSEHAPRAGAAVDDTGRLAPGDLFVTTRKTPTPEEEAQADHLARDLTLPHVARVGRSIAHHARATGRPAGLVVRSDAIHLVQASRRLGFHPNMATRRLAGGALQGDHFLRAAGLRPGDHVLDCTCGMGADSIVAAHVVGSGGRIVALEAAPVLAQIVAKGLAHHVGPAPLTDAMRRIDHRHAEADAFLAACPQDSFDVVVFDPMFAWPQAGSHGLDLVRLFASDWAPSQDTLAQARRVARRAIVMADGTPGPRLTELGIPIVSRDRRRWWGRIDLDA